MKIYVAAKFEQAKMVKSVYQKLKDRGHTITHDWTDEDAEKFKNQAGYAENCAKNDLYGVQEADAVLLFNHDKLFGGATEMGIAIASGVPVYVVGREIRENIFFNLPASYVECFKTAKDAIEKMEIDNSVK